MYRPTNRIRRLLGGFAATMLLILPGLQSAASELHVGGAAISITPERPVALSGQMGTRISQKVESPCTATALALESREGWKD